MSDIEFDVSVASVIPQSVDATLSTRGVAADAKAVGDALLQKANRSELPHETTVNGIESDNDGNITLTAENIPFAGSETTLQSLSNHESRLSAVEQLADEAAEACELAKTAVQRSGDTMSGGLGFLSGQKTVTIQPPALSEDGVVYLPKSGTIATTGAEVGRHELRYLMTTGYIYTSSKELVCWIPFALDGRNITKVEAAATVAVRSEQGSIVPAQNHSSTSVSASEFNALDISYANKNNYGFQLHATASDAWYVSGSTSTTKFTNGHLVSVTFNNLAVEVE